MGYDDKTLEIIEKELARLHDMILIGRQSDVDWAKLRIELIHSALTMVELDTSNQPLGGDVVADA